MFKKPLSGLKTSTTLRGSDRRKLKQRVVTAFGSSPEDGDLLVPDGIQSVKFSSYLEEPGVAYLAPDGNPLWFTIGKGSEDLIPTVYTLWKRRDLLPVVSTPAPVIPILIGGADLMIPGVVYHAPALKQDQLVSIVQYDKGQATPTLSFPLAVGRMSTTSDQLEKNRQGKGKAVYILHTWKDHLWELGLKGDVPEAVPFNSDEAKQEADGQDAHSGEGDDRSEASANEALQDLAIRDSERVAPSNGPFYTPQEINTLLHASLLQSISSIPANTFPVPATTFYTNFILPSRPAFPASLVPHSGPSPPDSSPCPSASEITIKSSAHKSLTAFLKSEEKAGLLTLKAPQKHIQQADLLVMSVNASHHYLEGHVDHVTVREIEAKAAKRALREEKERQDQAGGGEVKVAVFWKPHLSTVPLFETMGANGNFYSHAEIKALLNSYIASNSLVNPGVQGYINLNEPLIHCVTSKGQTKSQGGEKEVREEPVEFMKREDLYRAVIDRMQNWYEVSDHKDTVRKKGELRPVQIVVKNPAGRRWKVSTAVHGFEPFLVVNAEVLGEDLRKLCAGATSISPIPGKPANSGLEVVVQGKQSTKVAEYLNKKGIPKKWIEIHDLSKKIVNYVVTPST